MPQYSHSRNIRRFTRATSSRYVTSRDSASTKLSESIKKMGYHQLGIQLCDEDIAAIAVWMRSLTGDLDPAKLTPPQSASAPKIANLR